MNFKKKKSIAPRLSPQGQGRLVSMACGLLVTLVAAFVLFYPPELLRFFDFRIFDLLLSGSQRHEFEHRPVVVGIDEESLLRFGQWPWPRYRLAQLITALDQQGVAAIGIDLLMPEADRTSLDVILQERQRDLHEELLDASWLQNRQQNDQLLADAISSAPVVLGFKFLSGQENDAARQAAPSPLPGVVVRSGPGVAPLWAEPTAVLSSLDLLMQSAGLSGFVNAVTDRDGVVRRVPLLLKYQEDYYLSLALATVQKAVGGDRIRFDVLAQETILGWNDQQIPLDRHGNMLLDFSKDAAYRYVSAATLLQGELPENSLSGAVVFVGALAAGLGDRHVTPLDQGFPGLKIHAVVASNLLNGNWYSHPVWARGIELLCVVLFGGLSAWLLSFFGLRLPLLLSLVGIFGVSWGAIALFRFEHYFVSPTMPVLVLLLNAGLLGLMRYGVAAKNLRHRTHDLLKAQDATIVSLVSLAETRDSDTGSHLLRTQRFVKTLAEQLQRDSLYSADIGDEDVQMLFQSAPLHDIGKVGIPDRILLKSGSLTEEEVEVMRSHTTIGARALGRAAEVLGDPDSYAYLHYARQMAAAHHERWDGSGYPLGLKGLEIPLAGRLMALADVYDALVSVRCYKDACPHEETRDYLASMTGRLFDPEIVSAFLLCEEKFSVISEAYRDEIA